MTVYCTSSNYRLNSIPMLMVQSSLIINAYLIAKITVIDSIHVNRMNIQPVDTAFSVKVLQRRAIIAYLLSGQ